MEGTAYRNLYAPIGGKFHHRGGPPAGPRVPPSPARGRPGRFRPCGPPSIFAFIGCAHALPRGPCPRCAIDIDPASGPQQKGASRARARSADIPALIDDVKRLGDGTFDMTRCTFFVIDPAGAVHDWVADLRARRVPFLLFGLTPVLHRPDSRRRRFRDAESITAVFSAIEEVEGLVVETASLWLPNFAVETALGRKVADEAGFARGEVLRISYPLFQEALRFARDAIEAETFVEATRARLEEEAPRGRVVRHSAAESRAFREWSRVQFQEAHANYRRQRVDGRGVLRWRDKRGRAHEG